MNATLDHRQYRVALSLLALPVLIVLAKPMSLPAGVADEAPGSRGNAGTLTIEGLVTDETGQPLADVPVQLYERRPTRLTATKSDANGQFVFARLNPTIDRRLLVQDERRHLGAEMRLTAESRASADQTIAVHIPLQPTGSVVGQVLLDNRPAPGASIRLQRLVESSRQTRHWMQAGNATADQEGRFRVDNLLERKPHSMSVHLPGDPYRVVTLKNQGVYNQLQPASGVDTELPPMQFLSRNQSISGIVFDPNGEPLEGVTVSAHDARFGFHLGKSKPSDQEGHFQIDQLPQVRIRIEPDALPKITWTALENEVEGGDTDAHLWFLDSEVLRNKSK